MCGYKKGDKVRPLRKTIGDMWEDSLAIKVMKRQDQDFLYFDRETTYGSLVCSAENSLIVGEFQPSDLEPYELFELRKSCEEEDGTSNTLELNRGLLLELLQGGFFKEDVKFYVSK